jgi:MYXO-CTERM domain-containing protein
MKIWSTRRRQRGFVQCAAAVSTFAAASVALGAPRDPRLSYSDDTSTTISVAWNTDVDAPSEVKFGTTAGQTTQSATGAAHQATGALGWVHEVTLKNLQPATQYFYIAGSQADGFTPEKSFHTGPAQKESCGAFKFVYLGDNRPDPTLGGGENWPQILGQSAAHLPAFALNGGDLVIEGDQTDQWVDFLKWTSPVASGIPFMPSIGNHDTGPGSGDTANFNQLFVLPRSTGTYGSNTEDYYFFRYGNAIFVALSTEGFDTGTPKFGNQAAWLDDVLTKNPARWKFVFYHKPSYTHEALFSISHGPNESGQNEAWIPVFDKHHVDIVFTSHNHWYERYEPSACATAGKPGSSAACSVGANAFDKGTVYIVSGGAGAFTIPGMLCGSESGRAKCSGSHHYILFDINNETLKMETWGAAPQTNEVIDTVTITKSAVTCNNEPDAGPDGSTEGGAGGSDAAVPADASGGGGGAPGQGGKGGAAPDAAAAGGTGGVAAEAPASGSSGGCGCRTAPTQRAASMVGLLLAAAGLLRRNARR